MTEYALEALSKSRVKRVRVIGRRGPMQVRLHPHICTYSSTNPADSPTPKAAFTIKEIRELLNLPSVSFDPIDPTLLPPNPSTLPRASKRLIQLLAKGSPTAPSPSTKRWSLDFLLSPTSFNPSPKHPSSLSSITLQQTALQGPNPFDPAANVAPGAGPLSTFPAALAFRSIGYQSTPLPGMSAFGIPFDEKRGIIPNDLAGRILRAPAKGLDERAPAPGPAHLPGMYCAGWVKRGPTGVIASTMLDAFATAEAIAGDWEGGAVFLNGGSDGGGGAGARDGERGMGWEGLREEAEEKGLRRVSWGDWERIDRAERERGSRRGKEREKFASVREMLGVLD